MAELILKHQAELDPATSVEEQGTENSPIESPSSSPDTLAEEKEEKEPLNYLISELDDKIAYLENKNEELLGQNNQQEDYISSVQQDLEDTNRKLEMEKDANQELKLELEKVKEELKNKDELVQEVKDILRRTQNSAPRFDANVQQQQEIRLFQEERNRFLGKIESLKRERDDLARHGAHASYAQDLLQKNRGLEVERDEAKAHLQRMGQAYNKLIGEFDKATRESADLAEENKMLRTQRDESPELQEMTEGFKIMRQGSR